MSGTVETEVDQYRLLSDMLTRNLRWAEIADAKAAAVLFFVGATARVLVEPVLDSASDVWDRGLVGDGASETLIRVGFLLITLAVIGGFFWTIFHAFNTLVPRVRRHYPHGIMFFGDLARHEFDAWRTTLLGYSQASLIDDLAGQVYATGVIAAEKHRHARRAVMGILVILALAPLLYAFSRGIG